MSQPKNPLLKFDTFQTKHVMAAFRTTASAESVNLTSTSGNAGDVVGDGRIIVNEFTDARFTLPTIIWKWNEGGLTTNMAGYLELADRTGGQFVDWFRTRVIKALGVSTQHMTFSLKSYFMGVARETEEYDVVQGNPLIFHVHEFEDMMNLSGQGTKVKLYFTGAYNSTAQRVNLKPYQMTLTHRDGGLDNSDPEVIGSSSGLQFRSVEDGIKIQPRLDRLDKSKPMKNLKDLFDSLQKELNQQTLAHKRQVQKWLKIIRDGYEDKIDPDPDQERGEKLPIRFEVKLDPEYQTYEVDNRNLPFEQVNEDKDASGVVSVPIKAGLSLVDIAAYLMKFSRKVGEDAALSRPKTFKVNVSYIKESSQLRVVIKVKKIEVPINSVSIDTGPGEAIRPLNFTFKTGERTDVDITYLKTSITTDDGFKTLETGPRSAVLGNREPTMGERIPLSSAGGVNFFKSEFSGLRTSLVPYLNSGLEDGPAGANIDIMTLVENEQSSSHEIEIYGNPNLMYDLQRKPSEAASLNTVGNANYYKIPESYPMYLTIDIFLKPDTEIGLVPPTDLPQQYYYKNHYQITGVTNMLIDSSFRQRIQLSKRDDII